MEANRRGQVEALHATATQAREERLAQSQHADHARLLQDLARPLLRHPLIRGYHCVHYSIHDFQQRGGHRDAAESASHKPFDRKQSSADFAAHHRHSLLQSAKTLW